MWWGKTYDKAFVTAEAMIHVSAAAAQSEILRGPVLGSKLAPHAIKTRYDIDCNTSNCIHCMIQTEA